MLEHQRDGYTTGNLWKSMLKREISSFPDHRHKENGKLHIKSAENSCFKERQKTSVKCTSSVLRVAVVLDTTA